MTLTSSGTGAREVYATAAAGARDAGRSGKSSVLDQSRVDGM
jgi:hypothetical protein